MVKTMSIDGWFEEQNRKAQPPKLEAVEDNKVGRMGEWAYNNLLKIKSYSDQNLNAPDGLNNSLKKSFKGWGITLSSPLRVTELPSGLLIYEVKNGGRKYSVKRDLTEKTKKVWNVIPDGKWNRNYWEELISDTEASLKQAKMSISALESERQKLINSINSQKKKLALERDGRSKMQLEAKLKNSFKKQVGVLEAIYKEKVGEIETNKKKYNALLHQKKILEATVSKMTRSIEEKDKNISKCEQAKKQLQSNNEKLQAMADEYNSKIHSKLAEMSKKPISKKEDMDKITEDRNRLDEINKKMMSNVAKINNMDSTITQLNVDKNKFKAVVERKDKDISDLNKKISALNTSKAEIEKEHKEAIDGLMKEKLQLMDVIAEREKDVRALNLTLKGISSNIEKLPDVFTYNIDRLDDPAKAYFNDRHAKLSALKELGVEQDEKITAIEKAIMEVANKTFTLRNEKNSLEANVKDITADLEMMNGEQKQTNALRVTNAYYMLGHIAQDEILFNLYGRFNQHDSFEDLEVNINKLYQVVVYGEKIKDANFYVGANPFGKLTDEMIDVDFRGNFPEYDDVFSADEKELLREGVRFYNFWGWFRNNVREINNQSAYEQKQQELSVDYADYILYPYHKYNLDMVQRGMWFESKKGMVSSLSYSTEFLDFIIKNYEELIEKQIAEIDEQAQAIDDKDAKLKAQEDDITQKDLVILEHKQLTKEQQEELEKQKLEIEGKAKELLDNMDKIERLNGEVAEMTTELQQKKERIDSQSGKIVDLRAKVKALEKEIKQHESQNSQLQADLEAVQNENNNLSIEIDNLKSESKALQDKVGKLDAKLLKVQEEYADYQLDSEKRISALKDQLEKIKAENEQLRKENAELKAEYEKVSEEYRLYKEKNPLTRFFEHPFHYSALLVFDTIGVNPEDVGVDNLPPVA